MTAILSAMGAFAFVLFTKYLLSFPKQGLPGNCLALLEIKKKNV